VRRAEDALKERQQRLWRVKAEEGREPGEDDG